MPHSKQVLSIDGVSVERDDVDKRHRLVFLDEVHQEDSGVGMPLSHNSDSTELVEGAQRNASIHNASLDRY